MSKFIFNKGEVPFRSEKIRIYYGILHYSIAKVIFVETRLVILQNEAKKRPSGDVSSSPFLQEATLNEFLSKLIKDKEEDVLSINYTDIISVKLKRANPLISFLKWNWFYYIRLIYRNVDGKVQKIRFYSYTKEHSRYWRVNNRGTRRIFEEVRDLISKNY